MGARGQGVLKLCTEVQAVILMPSHSVVKVMHFLWGGGGEEASTKVSGMWSLAMCGISSAVAGATQAVA